MSEERLAGVLREFVDAVNKKDVEKALSCFQDDASYQSVEGTFKGKSEIKRYLTWAIQTASNLKITETGIGLLVRATQAYTSTTWREPTRARIL